MAESHVVTGLVAKRAELAGRIEAHRRELEQLEAHVGHLDGAIKLFAPDYQLEGIRAKPPRRRNRFFLQGECQRLVLEIFREAAQPLSAPRLAEALARRKGLEASSAVIEPLRKSALGVVKRLVGKGVIAPAGSDDAGTAWRPC
jgi:hypothetical protein